MGPVDPKVEYPGTKIACVTQQNHCSQRKYEKIIKSILKIPVYQIVPSLLASSVKLLASFYLGTGSYIFQEEGIHKQPGEVL